MGLVCNVNEEDYNHPPTETYVAHAPEPVYARRSVVTHPVQAPVHYGGSPFLQRGYHSIVHPQPTHTQVVHQAPVSYAPHQVSYAPHQVSYAPHHYMRTSQHLRVSNV